MPIVASELFKKAKKIEIATRRLVDERLAGQYHSVFKGRGLVFSDVRPYIAGDDVRSIDWNVSARMNAPHVKQFVEERDRTVNLMIDMSASGVFGTGDVVQARAGGRAGGDGGVLGDQEQRSGRAVPGDRQGRALRAAQEGPPPRHAGGERDPVVQAESRTTDLGAGLDFLGKIARRRSVVFLVSDFLSDGWDRPMRITAQRHELVPVVLADPVELMPCRGSAWCSSRISRPARSPSSTPAAGTPGPTAAPGRPGRGPRSAAAADEPRHRHGADRSALRRRADRVLQGAGPADGPRMRRGARARWPSRSGRALVAAGGGPARPRRRRAPTAAPGPADGGATGDAGPPRIVIDGPTLLGIGKPQVSASASPTELRLGDKLTLFVEVVFDEHVTVSVPAGLDLAPAFDELKRSSVDERRSDGTRKRVYQIQLQAGSWATCGLPPVQVTYSVGGDSSWVVTNEVPLRIVGSIDAIDDPNALLGATPPVPLRRDWLWIAWRSSSWCARWSAARPGCCLRRRGGRARRRGIEAPRPTARAAGRRRPTPPRPSAAAPSARAGQGRPRSARRGSIRPGWATPPAAPSPRSTRSSKRRHAGRRSVGRLPRDGRRGAHLPARASSRCPAGTARPRELCAALGRPRSTRPGWPRPRRWLAAADLVKFAARSIRR
jgi:hypothetical protein